MSAKPSVILKPESPFYKVFPEGRVPILNGFHSKYVKLEGSEESEVYLLDVGQCTFEQLQEVSEIIAAGAPEATAAQVMIQIYGPGLPIRKSQVERAEGIENFGVFDFRQLV